jgi:zinc/manganese transport system ATP-binding protein
VTLATEPSQAVSGAARVAAPDVAVAFEDVAVTRGGRMIWEEATFQVRRGEFVAIIGPNGAGKSTLLQVILGHVPPCAGRVAILGGRPCRGNRAVGQVPQNREVVSDLAVRGRDLVLLGIEGHRWGFGPASAQARQLTRQALEAVDALAFADEPLGMLSAGQQQRLLLAQALVPDLRLLLLDEPLTSLDLRSQHEIVGLVAALRRRHEVTVLFVCHDLNPVLPVVDRVLFILDGRLCCGTVAEVVQPEVLSRLYGAPIQVFRTADGALAVRGG